MSENFPLNYKTKLKYKRKIPLLNKKKYRDAYENIKKDKFKTFFYISFVINIVFLLYILILKKQINRLKNNINNANIFKPSYKNTTESEIHENEEYPILNYTKDELLEMCYKSRSLFFTRYRREKTDMYLNKYHDTNSETIQNKINYLLVHESPDYKTKIVDKIGLHEYSTKVLGKDICVPLIKTYSSTDEINLDELPNQFVLKCNHGSNMNILVNDKSRFNLNSAKADLNNWRNIDYGLREGEFQYINVERKFLAERFLKDNIEDYKIYCFHSEPKLIRVQKHIESTICKINNYYSLDWNLTDIETGFPGFCRDPKIQFEKPKHLDLMLSYARKLSAEFVFVRVDFYEVNDTVYLGELTFSPTNAQFSLKNLEQSKYLGSFLDVSKIKKYLFN